MPDTHNEFSLDKLNNPEFEIQETEHDTQVVPDEREPMLTQIIDEIDTYYVQYTLYEKRTNQTATALYQMLKIQDLSLNNREKYLDLLCFPDLYSFGINEQHEDR